MLTINTEKHTHSASNMIFFLMTHVPIITIMMVTIQRQRNILVHFAFWILIKFSQNWKRLLFQTALCGSRSITHRNEWHRLGSSPCIHCRHPPPPPTAPHHSLAKFINFMKIIQRAVELFSVSSYVHFQLKTPYDKEQWWPRFSRTRNLNKALSNESTVGTYNNIIPA